MGIMPERTATLRPVAVGVLIAVGMAAAGLSCSEDPTPENSLVAALPLAQFVFHDTTVSAAGDSSFRQYTPMNSDINLLGTYNGYTAYLPLEFYPSYFPTRDTATVLSAKLMLHAASWFGDSTAPFAFTVYRVLRAWDPSSLQWDSLQMSLYDPSTVYGTYSGTVGPDTETIVVNLDTGMVHQWLESNTSTTTTKYGIILIPAPQTNVVRGFYAFDVADSLVPSLEIIARNPSATAPDTSTYTNGQDTFAGNIDNLLSTPTLLYVQSGVPYRSMLKFDVSFLPRGAIVNKAEMLLHRDASTSHATRFTTDTAVAAHVLVSGSDFTQFQVIDVSMGRRASGTSDLFSFDLRHAVQYWIALPNYGILLTGPRAIDGLGLDGENTTFDLTTFFSTRADSTLRPRLRILYSVETK